MKQYIKSFLNWLGLFKNRYLKACFRYDFVKFEDFSGISLKNEESAVAQMRIICHTIEKAFSLPDCRVDFGRKKVESLIVLYNFCVDKAKDENALELCRSIIYCYYKYRCDKGLDVSFIPNTFHYYNGKIKSGVQQFGGNQLDLDFKCIASSRHSIRNFADTPVKESDIVEAVKVSQTAPSACNRQATRVYSCIDKSKIDIIKESHGGIRTFGNPGVILAITQDLRLYLNEYERNTWLVDGGIFCMNMLYALQSVGIGACPVIWGGMKDEDERISSLFNIPKYERVVVLIVGGYPPSEGYKTPYSAKRPVEDVLRIVK